MEPGAFAGLGVEQEERDRRVVGGAVEAVRVAAVGKALDPDDVHEERMHVPRAGGSYCDTGLS
jgi:hypothetical protein